jgi:hypothetical protein
MVDPYIRTLIKLTHYTSKLFFPLLGIETDYFNRWLINLMIVRPKYTGDKYVGGFNVDHLIDLDIYLSDSNNYQ